MYRYKITIEYDGVAFCGWQKQLKQLSIQEIIEKAILPISKIPTKIYGSGRTDAGVHALGQVAHFDLVFFVPEEKILSCIQYHVCPHPIAIKSIELVNEQFHARFSAVERHYLYKIFNSKTPPALQINKVWWIKHKLDIEKMHKASQCLIGHHDFSTFRDSKCQSHSPIKTLTSFSVTSSQEENMINISCSAKSFLHHQVRNMVGTLLKVGQHQWSCDDFSDAFHTKDRRKGGITAPAYGLYLLKVEY